MQMRYFKLITRLVVIVAFVPITSVCAALLVQEPEILSEVDRSRIYEGESIIFNVMLNHIDNPPEPTLDGFDDFQVELLGKQSQNSQQISIINGRRSEIIRRGMLFQYRLTPTKAGRLTIPAPTADIDGQTVTGRKTAVTVIAPQEQSTVILEVTSDKESVYALQPFTVTLTMAVAELPGELSQISPLAIQRQARSQQAALTVPWLDDEQTSDRLEPATDWKNILQPIMNDRSDGVTINGVDAGGGGFFFDRARDAVFLPKSTSTTRTAADGTVQKYVEYTIQRKFVAKRVGPISFAACNIKGIFGTEATDDGQLQVAEIYAVSNRLTVDVKSPPAAGRPDSYTGAIGTFDISATLTPEVADVGDPLTLSVTVFGEGTVADIRPPDLAKIPQLADNFRIYEPTETTVGNGRQFTYAVRATNSNVTEFPSVPFSYFDVTAEEYKSLQTPAIPVKIEAAKQLLTSDIVAASRPDQPLNDALQANTSGLFANHSGLQSLQATSFSIRDWAGIWAAMIVGFVALNFGVQRQQRRAADPALVRRRNAKAKANTLLKTLSPSMDGKSLLENMNRTISGLIADYTNTPEAGMTSTDAAAQLDKSGVAAELQQRTQAFMAECDAARYGASADATSGLLDQCQQLVADLSRELEKLA